MPSRRYERDHAATFPDTRPGGGFDNAVKEALRRPLNKVFGTPEEPTRLGRFMNGLEEGAALSMMAYGGAAGRVGNLRRFTQLSRRPGVQPSTLKKWTNIERGVYGLGVETKGDAYLRPASVYGGLNNRPLAQMAWVHPDVLKVHPKMGEVPVAIVPDAAWVSTVERARRGMTSWSRDGSTADGFSMSGGRGIAIRGARPGEDIIAFNERADRTLVHEMQHVSQDFDGIRPARGHASYNEYRTDGREVDARNTANRNHLTPQERTEMPRSMTQDVKADLVQLDDKGGDNFGTFRNFLATDEVPDSLFGYPIAHDENGYTEKDIQFFKENPKAAGFYDLGDEEIEESGPETAPVHDDLGGDADWDFEKGDGGPRTVKGNRWKGNLRVDGLKPYFFRDDDGRITGYGTTNSTIAERDGKFYVIPTIIEGGAPLSQDAAELRFRSTGEHWAVASTRKEAERLSNEVHNVHQTRYGRLWNEYIQSHWDDMSPQLQKSGDLADIHAARIYVAGLAAEPGSFENQAGKVVERAYDAMVLTPGVEGFDPVARWDVTGYALGHGAHYWGGAEVQKGQRTTWREAASQFQRDIESRHERLAERVPRYGELPLDYQVALLDIAMGKDEGGLTGKKELNLFTKLRAAKDIGELKAAVESEYPTWGANTGALVRQRRMRVARKLFGKTLEYKIGADGKYWGSYKEE